MVIMIGEQQRVIKLLLIFLRIVFVCQFLLKINSALSFHLRNIYLRTQMPVARYNKEHHC